MYSRPFPWTKPTDHLHFFFLFQRIWIKNTLTWFTFTESMILLILHIRMRRVIKADLIWLKIGVISTNIWEAVKKKKKGKSSGEYFVYKLMETLAQIIFALWHLHVWIHKGISAYLGFYTSISYCESEKPMETLYDCDTNPWGFLTH